MGYTKGSISFRRSAGSNDVHTSLEGSNDGTNFFYFNSSNTSISLGVGRLTWSSPVKYIRFNASNTDSTDDNIIEDIYVLTNAGGGGGGDTSASAGAGSATPGGSDTDVQFNDGGVLGGDSNFIFTKSNGRVGMGGIAAPARALDITESGTHAFIRITSAGDTEECGLELFNTDDDTKWFFYRNKNDNNRLILLHESTTLMSFLPTGRIGVGPTNAAPPTVFSVSGVQDQTLIGREDLVDIQFRVDSSATYAGDCFKGGLHVRNNTVASTTSNDDVIQGCGGDFAVTGASHGESSTIGINVNVSGADNNYTALFNTGNVGINTTAPDKDLEINNATGGTIRLTFNDEDGGATVFCDLSVNSSGDFIVDDSNVGIGATSPAAKLEVEVADNDNVVGLLVDQDDVTNNNFAIEIQNAGTGDSIHDNSGAKLTAVGVFTDASDISKKYDVNDISYDLDTISQLRPVNFKYKKTDKEDIGFIAQEVKNVIPEVVYGEDGDYSMSYGSLTSILTKGIQQQQEIITTLQNENATLKTQMADVLTRLARLEA